MSENIELYPRLVVKGADAALAFYSRAFGGEVIERYTGPDGGVVHAMVQAGPVRFAVKDADEYDPAPGPDALPVIIALFVTDPDEVADRMIAGGAEVIYPIADHDYGDVQDRGGRLRDPFGHLWMIAARR
jgi:uncharacterized glyoxalase superfamily protein PhnB